MGVAYKYLNDTDIYHNQSGSVYLQTRFEYRMFSIIINNDTENVLKKNQH